MKKRVLLFSPPFSGHLYVLKKLIQKHKKHYDFKLIITGWKNIEPDTKNLGVPFEILSVSNLCETDPALWTLPRASKLIDECLLIAHKFKPDVIVYDYFSLEGHLVGKTLNIPTFSSIPALVGDFTQQKYLNEKLSTKENRKAIADLEKRFPKIFNHKNLEMVSDGLHLPAEHNLLWSYKNLTPKNFLNGRACKKYSFIGRLDKTPIKKTAKKPLIYFSLGTVVMDNLWNQLPKIRKPLKKTIKRLTELWSSDEFDVLFVDRGRKLVKKYPKNWHNIYYANQVKILSKASVFVTHAGGNSFHEAIMLRVPMIAIPFFGDQPLIAEQIEKLGLGFNLVKDKNIDTKKIKDFIGNKLAEKIDLAAREILKNPKQIQKNFSQIKLQADKITKFL